MNRDDRKRTDEDWQNNLEKNHLFKDEDKLKGLHLEVAYTCLCSSEGDSLHWRLLPIALDTASKSLTCLCISGSSPQTAWHLRGTWVVCAGPSCAEVRANIHTVVEPGVQFRTVRWALVSTCLPKLSGGQLGSKGWKSHLNPWLSHLHLSLNLLKPAFCHFSPKWDS